jgi:hypothetical protein
MKELTIEELAADAMQLLPMSVDELFMVLGSQLLGTVRPTRVAGIMSYLLAAIKTEEAKNLYAGLPVAPAEPKWGEGFELIWGELIRDGKTFVQDVREELRKGVCNEDVRNLAKEINASSMQVIVMVVGAILKLPPQFDAITATVAAILCKSGLDQVCS